MTAPDATGAGAVGAVQYRFLDAMGDVVVERSFVDHEAALAWACGDEAEVEGVQRVEFRGPRGDWRWAGALSG